jgi:hypothetical protein
MKASVRRGIVEIAGAAALSLVMIGSAAGYAIDQDLGSPANESSSFAHEIDISRDTRWVNVDEGEVVKFVDASSGKSFYWRFDTLAGKVMLDRIAPAGFLAGQHVDAYVNRGAAQD